MAITTAPDPQAVLFGEFDKILQTQDRGRHKRVLGCILYTFSPILKTNPFIHLPKSKAYHGPMWLFHTFIVFFLSASSYIKASPVA